MAESRNAAGESEVLLAGKTLDKIPYSDKPLTHPDAKIIYLTHEEFFKRFSCRYSESIHGNKKLVQECQDRIFKNCTYSQINSMTTARLVKERLEQPLDSLVICKIEDRHVLMTSKPIPKRTLVAIYAGEIKLAKDIDKFEDSYQYDLTTPVMQECIYSATPHKIGGIGRFMQHLPAKPKPKKDKEVVIIDPKSSNIDEWDSKTEIIPIPEIEDELANVVFTIPAPAIAYRNIYTILINYNGIPLTLMLTRRDIEAKELLGYSFGQNYSIARNEYPRYFTTNAELIPLNSYYHKGPTRLYFLEKVRTNALLVYEEAVKLYKRKQYEHALAAFRLSTDLFVEKNPEGSMDAAKCLSGMVSCYRELNNLPDALKACELAMPIYAKNESKDLDQLYIKYQECLAKDYHPEKYSIEEMSASADALFHRKDYKEALRIFACLSYRYKQKTGDHRSDIAFCHSVIHHCYVALSQIDLAIYHCKTALQIRKSVPGLAEESMIIDDNEQRLAHLQACLCT